MTTTTDEELILKKTTEDLRLMSRITNANAESVSEVRAEKLRRASLELDRIGRELEAA